MRHTQTHTPEQKFSTEDSFSIGFLLGIGATMIGILLVLTRLFAPVDVLCAGYNLAYGVPTRVYNNICYVEDESTGEYIPFEELLEK